MILAGSARAFAPPRRALAYGRSAVGLPPPTTALGASVAAAGGKDSDFWIPREDLRFKVLKIGKGAKQKVMNLYGLWVAAVCLVTVPPWIVALRLEQLRLKLGRRLDPARAFFDRLGKIWAKTWLRLIGSYPTQSGNVESLKGKGIGPCLYVANHGSWLDIAIICTVLEPVFKFIAKGDLRAVPGIGLQLTGGDHILIDREDKRSQLKTFKDSVRRLRDGVPLMAFPEGTRSKAGPLLPFKGGMFAVARKAGVPIVPLSISHSYAVWPAYALLPAQFGRGKLHVHVHDPIVSEGRTEEELAEAVRGAFLSALPGVQLPEAETGVSAKVAAPSEQ